MRIAKIESFIVRAPIVGNKPFWGAGFWAKDPQMHPGLPTNHPGDITTEYPPIWRVRPIYASTLDSVVVRLETDSGRVGWGESHTPVAPSASKAVIDDLLTPLVIGQDALDIQPIWELMYSTMRLRGHSSGFMLEAISGIDIALWDVVGKSLGVPLAKLLGGQIRDRIPVYASSLPRVHVSAGEAGWQGLARTAHELVSQGYRSIKVKLGIDIEQDRRTLRVLRDAVGKDVSLSVDANGAYDLALARVAGRMMEDEKVLWLEEPLMPENLRGYSSLASVLSMPVAGGECLDNRWAFNDFLAAGAFDLIQPDVSRAGGISESKRISDLGDAYSVPFAPHVSIGTAIYMAASLQWAAAGPNLMMCEWPLESSVLGNDILTEPFRFERGFVQLSDRPGLGIDVNESALRRWQV
jgi:D-galactarolactone cycloisomerase